jgi:trimeric autotransporter adhesin
MSFRSKVCIFFITVLLVSFCHAQNLYPVSGDSDRNHLWVLAGAGREGLRVTALGFISRIRLEVFGQGRQRIYDSSFQSGSIIEWNLKDAGVQLSGADYYGCLVTFEDLNGNIGHRSGLFRIKDGQAIFDSRTAGLLSDSADQADNEIVSFQSEKPAPITLLAHDGNDGLILTGKGDLSFRIGDGISAKNTEQMRLTADGNLGIGVGDPQAKLDVSGIIRTSEGIMFPDGSIQKSAAMIGVVAVAGEGSGVLQDGAVSGSSGSGRKQLNTRSGPVTALLVEGSTNTFVGQNAGTSNTGGSNAFFGSNAGYFNTSGNDNSFFGPDAGKANTAGSDNAFFGYRAGYHNTASQANSFFGAGAGFDNTGRWNSFFGYGSGSSNSAGESNAFFGFGAGQSNTTESANTFVGAMSDGAAGVTNAAALGAFAKVTQSDSIVLGSINGVNGATADAKVGIGTTNPDRQLVVEGEQALIRFRRYYATAIHSPALLMEHARGTRAAPEDIMPGDYLGKVQFRGRVDGNYPEYGLFAFVAGDKSQNGRFSFIDKEYNEKVSIMTTGNMGIGTTNPTERLHVVGNFKVTGNIFYGALEEVPDYVFEPGYNLMPIKELENFLATEKHLPNIPSAAEIKQKNLNLGRFQMKLLEKIEELTLYVVNQEKVINQKDAELSVLKSQNCNLDRRLSALEQFLSKVGSK